MIPGSVVVALVVLAGFAAIALRCIVVVPADGAYVVERLGRHRITAGPGLLLLVPFVDRVRSRHRTTRQSMPVEANPAITLDNVPLRVAAELEWRIVDATKASYAVADVAAAVRERALVEIRRAIGEASLGDLLADRESPQQRVAAALRTVGAAWGIEVPRVELRALEPPPAVQETIAREAERERAARRPS